MPGRWRGGCPRDQTMLLHAAGNLAFVTLVPPVSRKRGWASPYSLGEPALRPLGELASNRVPASKIGLASNTVAPTGACSAPPHLLSGRRRLPLVQWLQILPRPTCWVFSGSKSRTAPLASTCLSDAGVCHCSVAPNFAPAPLVQWMLASPTCSMAPPALPTNSQLLVFFARKCLCQLKQRWKKI